MTDFVVIDNFISKNLCDKLIDFHKKYYTSLGNLQDNTNGCLYLDLYSAISNLQEENENNESDLLKHISSLLTAFLKTISPNSYINFSNIVAYPTHSSCGNHLDRDFSSWLLILYLNDNYIGGKNTVSGTMINPEVGKLIAFRGNKILHGVTEITSGTRYVLLSWCKDWNIE